VDRIQRALDLAKLQRGSASPAEEPRAERVVGNRELFITAPVPAPEPVVQRFAVNWSELSERRVLAPADTRPAAEAYRMLRTQVLQRARAHGLRTLGVVSPTHGEGKTLTAINLALSLSAEPNQTVVLLDLDLRRPSVARTLGLAIERGLESCLGGEELGFKPVSYAIEGVERFQVLPTLTSLPSSSDVLASASTRRLLTELKDRDPDRLLILDLPPVLLSDDVLAVAPLLDGVVLVVMERHTKREDVVRVIELLGNTRVVGTVLNRSSEAEQRAY
jgi:Mrp family chromosome partitioning ATPase